MIVLDLQQFGGRGGGDGSIGADHNTGGGKGGSKSHGGSAGGSGGGSGGGHGSGGGKSSNSSGGNTKSGSSKGEKVSAVKENETYIISSERGGKESNSKAMAGKTILGFMRRGELRYDRHEDIWRDKKGKRYIIRSK